jgi:hypothetical protein
MLLNAITCWFWSLSSRWRCVNLVPQTEPLLSNRARFCLLRAKFCASYLRRWRYEFSPQTKPKRRDNLTTHSLYLLPRLRDKVRYSRMTAISFLSTIVGTAITLIVCFFLGCLWIDLRRGIYCKTCRLMLKVDKYLMELFKNAAKGRLSSSG